MRQHLLAFALLTFAELSLADLYQCIPESEIPYFSDTSCKPGETSVVQPVPEGNSYEGTDVHYNFEDANYKSSAYLTVNDVADKYACAALCRQDPECRVATYFNDNARKRKRQQCKLRQNAKNKETGTAGTDSWVK